MIFNVLIKSGTSGHADEDNCNLLVKENIYSTQLPAKDDIIVLEENYQEKRYLVTQVERHFNNRGEFNNVYVVNYS